jgi:hypothetical protein
MQQQHQEDPRRQPRARREVDLSHPSGQDGQARGPHGCRHILALRRFRLHDRLRAARRRRLHRHVRHENLPQIMTETCREDLTGTTKNYKRR